MEMATESPWTIVAAMLQTQIPLGFAMVVCYLKKQRSQMVYFHHPLWPVALVSTDSIGPRNPSRPHRPQPFPPHHQYHLCYMFPGMSDKCYQSFARTCQFRQSAPFGQFAMQ